MIEMTYTATIYVGFKEHYDGLTHTLDELRGILSDYVNAVGLCVTMTPTEFIYKNGGEPGAIIGLINYPRFPSTPEDIRDKALAIAAQVMERFNQYRVTVVFPDQTHMLEGKE